MENVFNKVVMITIEAEGYRSGATALQVGFVEKEVYEDWKEEIESYTSYFGDLDGKHSEVEGETSIMLIEDEFDLRRAIDKQGASDGDYFIFEGMLCEACDIESLEKFHEEFALKLSTEVSKKYYFDGKEVI